MSATEMQIVEMLRSLPEPALDEIKVFIDFLSWRYHQTSVNSPPQSRGEAIVAALVGKGTANFTTDEIMGMTRGEE